MTLLLLLLLPAITNARPPAAQPLSLATDAAHRRSAEPLDQVLGRDLAALWAHHRQSGGAAIALPFAAAPLLAISGQMVAIDAVALSDPPALMADLTQLGMGDAAPWGRVISGWFPIAALGQLGALAELAFARPAYAWSNTGSVTSQGDIAQRSDTARAALELNGQDVPVGVLSDSYNCLDGAADDIAGGDLPPSVLVLAEFANCTIGIDEGRAMLQIVHDCNGARATPRQMALYAELRRPQQRHSQCSGGARCMAFQLRADRQAPGAGSCALRSGLAR